MNLFFVQYKGHLVQDLTLSIDFVFKILYVFTINSNFWRIMPTVQCRSIFSNTRSQEPLLLRNSMIKKTIDSTTHTIAHKIMHNLRIGHVFNNKTEWKRNISALSNEQLKEVLDIVTRRIACLDNPIKTMEQLAEIIPLQQLQKAIQIEHPLHIDALQTAKEMLSEALQVLQAGDERPSLTLRLRLSAALNSLISMIESILSGFGIAEFFKPADSPLEASWKSQQIMMLLQFSTLLVTIIGTVVGSAPIGWTLASIAGLSLIYPYIRPAPSHLFKGINWTKQYNQGELLVSQGRKKSLDEVAHALLASTKVKTHPLLIGRSGVGKTETMKAFVQAIERGDYPELRGKQVFYFNTADLVKSSEMFQSENKALSKISEEIGRHRNNIILVFDEIHLGIV